MSHRGGALGIDRPLPAVGKNAVEYLFVQAEFGLMCPISVTDTSIHLIRKYRESRAEGMLLPRMLSADMATQWKGTQFMTEKCRRPRHRRDRNGRAAAKTASGGSTATSGSARTPTPT